jgi:hypothetical protein
MSEQQVQPSDVVDDGVVTAAPAAEPPMVDAPLSEAPVSEATILEAPMAEVEAEAAGARPDGVPEKFWDAEAGALRTDALLKSYRELERKLGHMVPLPADDGDHEAVRRLQRALGVPDSPEGYHIEASDELLAPDPEINARLHEAGFTGEQAQLVYDLAASHMLPMLDDALGEVEASREAERLASHFGGSDAWGTTARQIKTWGEANLAPEVFQTLASSFEGVLAMHHMMQAREPSALRDADGPAGMDEPTLASMMRDPRYWRDRDPRFVAEVTEGFRRLYSDD